MTKSGIGTVGSQTAIASGTVNSSGSNGSTTNVTNIAQAEIPIWVADKKKWVTGISKKTTINDLIQAILKQCQIAIPSGKDNIGSNNSSEPSSQYVLVEYVFETTTTTTTTNNEQQQSQQIVSSQKIIDGDNKVYKHLSKWLQPSSTGTSLNNNLLLKILLRQPVEMTTTANSENNNNSSNNSNSNNQTSTTSLASKLLKKFGVSHSNTSNSNQNLATQNSNVNSNNNINNNVNTGNASYRYVDVKLPKATTTTTLANGNSPQQNQQHMNNNGSTKQNNFDPNVQKSFVYTTIVDRENRLKQQRERFQLIDEMIREAEKKSKIQSSEFFNGTVANNSQQVHNSSTNSSTSSTSSISQLNTNTNLPPMINNSTIPKPTNPTKTNVVDLNDIYCHFPEMCTHQLNEVQDFTQMCSQLFQLEEAIKAQKQVLSNLESDLQRELNPTVYNNSNNQCMSPVPMVTMPSGGGGGNNNNNQQTTETPETLELRKEVTLSREQTRLQCKQLHDLDAKMRSNEQTLMVREQQLQQLLEELYIQEIYADNAWEKAITNHDHNHNQHIISNSLNHDLPDVDENDEEERILFADFEHNSNQHDPVELKILNNDHQQFEEIHQFNNQLSSHHKSLSYGNLSSNPPQINEPINDQNNQQQHQQIKTMNLISKSMHGKLLKNSPSLELTSASNKAGVYMSKMSNSSNNSNNLNVMNHNGGNTLNGSGGDHSGDNDSGISSMSSETTTAAIQNCNNVNSNNTSNNMNTQKSNTHGNMRNATPTSLQIINANASNGNVSIPILNSTSYFNQNQYQMQRQPIQFNNHQFQQQPHISNNGSKPMKSVLETLV